MDARADEKRDEAIRKLKKLLPTVPEGPQKAELVFRLSEMYWAKSKAKHLSAMRQWDQALEIFERLGTLIEPGRVREELAGCPTTASG